MKKFVIIAIVVIAIAVIGYYLYKRYNTNLSETSNQEGSTISNYTPVRIVESELVSIDSGGDTTDVASMYK